MVLASAALEKRGECHVPTQVLIKPSGSDTYVYALAPVAVSKRKRNLQTLCQDLTAK